MKGISIVCLYERRVTALSKRRRTLSLTDSTSIGMMTASVDHMDEAGVMSHARTHSDPVQRGVLGHSRGSLDRHSAPSQQFAKERYSSSISKLIVFLVCFNIWLFDLRRRNKGHVVK